MTIKKSNIEIPGEWLEKIEKKPKQREINLEKKKQIEKFIKLKYPKYSLESIAKVCGVSRWTVKKIIENMHGNSKDYE